MKGSTPKLSLKHIYSGMVSDYDKEQIRLKNTRRELGLDQVKPQFLTRKIGNEPKSKTKEQIKENTKNFIRTFGKIGKRNIIYVR